MASILFVTTSAFAAGEADATEPSYPGWGIGIGAATQGRPYKDIDNQTRLLPVLSFENRWVRIAGLGVDLKLGSAGPVSFALGARYSLLGYQEDDAPILRGMAERQGGLWIGPSVMWRSGYADVAAEALGDASGNSKGAQFRLTVERSFQRGAFRFTPRAAALWRDGKYNDYYYGVRAHEARAGRPFYQGRASTDFEIGLRTGYSLARQHSVFLDVSTTRYGKGVTDSPLVDKSSATGVRIGYLYRF